MRRLPATILAITTLAAPLACDNSSSPTAPAAPQTPAASPWQEYTGSLQVASVSGSSSDSRIRCALGKLRGMTQQPFQFTLTINPDSPTGRIQTNLTNAPTCIFGHDTSGTDLVLSVGNCGVVTVEGCTSSVENETHGVTVTVDEIRMPRAASDGTLRGAGVIRTVATAYKTIQADEEWYYETQTIIEATQELLLSVNFDLRR